MQNHVLRTNLRYILASLILILGLGSALLGPASAFAQRSSAGQNALNFLDATAEKGGLSIGSKDTNYSSEDAVLGIIGNVISVILGFVGIIFFIQMFYAGFRWMSSGGNEEVVTEAKQTIRNTVIGIVVVFAAFVVTNFVLNQIASITGPTRPSADFIQPEDTGGDPNLTAPENEDLFGDLPPAPEPTGNCRYSLPDECRRRTMSGSQPGITQNACAQLADSSCGGSLGIYEWQ